jgi:cAMP and cAMP-inhibited cGMP 3',5'-cyclic phosphodiesterase 10
MHADIYSWKVSIPDFWISTDYFNSVIGVVQMVNKQTGVFTIADEESFETFAIYCGLALHHAKLYDKIRRSEQKYRVALEVLAYHSVCNKDEVNKVS